ncbi:hypothetical protein [Methanosphaera sp. BMS]|uniref:hypothetical protein n=1 Tax=Methanosphaera sp. BMS TaxID=1789762 RepID=UPI000DC1E0C6|nr:hypothetical protein [Methanosphaera sp. BMS]AWX31844.1 hypothetical protein AW729_01500 [Methanosphaera sp. BMS]
MIEYYTPEQLAYFCYEEKYDLLKVNNLVEKIYREEYSFINKNYHDNQELFLEEILMYQSFLTYEELYDNQVKHHIDINNHLEKYEKFINDFSPNFFLITRLILLYHRKYRVIKLRTLLKKFGYKKRSPFIIQKIRDNVMFYHLKIYIDGELVNIEDCDLDDMITFRLY